jgi:hypothetical protein
MNKKALLIGSPGGSPPLKYLNGVEQDLTNMIRFLTSANGGGWNEKTEIIRIPDLNPKYSVIEPYLNELRNCDFAFLYFSGHGYTDNNNNGKINLNENEQLFVNNLALLCKKQITIIDACRGYTKHFNDIGAIGTVQQIFSFDNNHLSDAKQVFDSYLSNCPDGRVLLYASQVGEDANDTPIGGYFSTNIFFSSQDLIKAGKKSVVSIYEVFSEAFERTKDQHRPQMKKSNEDALKLPFVVNPNVRVFTERYTNQPVITLEDIAKAALTRVVIVGAAAIIIDLLTPKNEK